jgi:hypothetical protein
MISLRDWIVIAAVAIAMVLAVVLGWDFFINTLGLQPKVIVRIAAAVGFTVIVGILFAAFSRSEARRPGKSPKRQK